MSAKYDSYLPIVSIIPVLIFVVLLSNQSLGSCPEDCSGHGRCLTTYEMFERYTPNHASYENFTNWEANHTTGCACDIGMKNYLSLHEFLLYYICFYFPGYSGAACEISKSQ